MKSAPYSIVILSMGLCLGWVLRSYTGDLTSLTSSIITSCPPISSQPICSEEPTSRVNNFPGPTSNHPHETPINESPINDDIFRSIQQQNVEHTIALLQKIDLEQADNYSIAQALHNNYYALSEQGNWRTLKLWIEAMLSDGYQQSVLHTMDSKIRLSQGDYLAAIEARFLAKHYSLTADEIGFLQEDIENLVIIIINKYQSDDISISRQSTFEILAYAIEKQPNNPLFGIEFAKLQAGSNDIVGAIDTLNLIPYNERYQNIVVSLKTQWLNQLNENNNSEMVTTAIPLHLINGHFLVTAVINQEETIELLIDTGATTTAISSDAISYLKSRGIVSTREKTVLLSTANGTIESDLYSIDLFAIGEYTVEEFMLLEIELEDTVEFDGLLGMNFLSLFEFEIDQTNRQLFLTPK